jgi:acetylornithine/succinyldiaminopimelate/putrescine aminotransferase
MSDYNLKFKNLKEGKLYEILHWDINQKVWLYYVIKNGLLYNTGLKSYSTLSQLEILELEFKEIKQIKGRGLMLGVEFEFPVAELRKNILFDHKILTGNAANPNLLRILPSLSITKDKLEFFAETVKKETAKIK